jgi:exosortase E/protease (VPEID-CTERM system)
MSTPLDPSRTSEPAPLPIARWLFLGGLLVVELLLLTLRFDSKSLDGLDIWWAELFGHAHVLPRVAIAVAAATFLFGGNRLRADLRQAASGEAYLAAWPFLLGHLAALAAFTAVTAYVLEGEARDSPWAAGWAVGWLVLAALTLALWLAAILPASRWLPLARRSAGPLVGGVCIGLAAWGVGCFTDKLWVPLSQSTFWVVVRLLGLVTSDCISDPNALIVGTSTFSVQIAPSCSGYEGIGLMWVFVGVYLWCYRSDLRFPTALVLLPAATAVIWLANAGRIAALVAVGTWVSKDAALGGFHSQAGWLAFNAVALGVVLVAHRVPWIHKQVEEAAPAAEAGKPDATAAYLAPLMVLIATMMVTSAFVSDFDWPYPLRVVLTGIVLWHYRRTYTGLGWGWSWVAAVLGVAVFVAWLLLEPVPSSKGGAAFSDSLRELPPGWGLLWLSFRVLGSVVTVPLAEELAFRGFLTRRLIASHFEEVPVGRFTWLSFLVSSALFGLLHGRWLAGTLAGMVYALALYRRGRVGDAVLAHAVTNALLAVYVLITGSWWLW